MIASPIEAQLSGIAWLLAAIAAFVFAIAIAWVLVRRGFDRIDAKVTTKLGTIETTLNQTHVEVQQVNRAVNHVGPDDPAPLIQRVRDLEANDQWHRDAFRLLAENLGVDLPPHPKDQAA